MSEARAEEIFCRFRVDMATDEKEIRDRFRNAEPLLEARDYFGIGSAWNYPARIAANCSRSVRNCSRCSHPGKLDTAAEPLKRSTRDKEALRTPHRRRLLL